MIYIYAAVSLTILTFFLIKFCNKYHILENYNGDKHQKYTSSHNIPLIGGSVSLLFVFFFFNLDLEIKLFLASIFIVGILSDLKILVSASKKILLQFIIIIFFLYVQDIHLVSTKLLFLDFILKNTVFSFFFTAFCLLILINGTNFIDGTNGNVLIFYLIISILIFILKKNEFQTINNENIFLIIELIFILLIFNYSNKLYLGDSGSFLLGLVNSTAVIHFTQYYKLPPVFAVCILFYSWFEILFSFIRKIFFKKSPLNPDNFHLHLIIKKKLDLLISNNTLSSNITSIFINFILSINLYFVFTFRYQNFVLYLLIILQSFLKCDLTLSVEVYKIK
jgi:UDP-N-acetylmuramyl pentapeptide phosphotransferase/UDP-N-acetylglucosamine-1-phosphate transferase